MFRFQAFVDEFSVELHQLPLLPMLLKLPLVLRLPPGSAEKSSLSDCCKVWCKAKNHAIFYSLQKPVFMILTGIYNASGLPDLKMHACLCHTAIGNSGLCTWFVY
jgi:hypothetical protein